MSKIPIQTTAYEVDAIIFHQNRKGNSQTFAKSAEVYNLSSIYDKFLLTFIKEFSINRHKLLFLYRLANIERYDMRNNNLPTIDIENMHNFSQDGKVWDVSYLPEGFIIKANVNFSNSDMSELPDLSKVSVLGDFYCEKCQSLTSLQGSPREVMGDFYCSDCYNLTTLKGAPQKVGGDFCCAVCTRLKSLEGAPQEVGQDFGCPYCDRLISLEGAPRKVRNFYCGFCTKLKSLKGCPEYAEYLECGGCGSLKSFKYAPRNLYEPSISEINREKRLNQAKEHVKNQKEKLLAKLTGSNPNLQKVVSKITDTKVFNAVALEIAKAKFMVKKR